MIEIPNLVPEETRLWDPKEDSSWLLIFRNVQPEFYFGSFWEAQIWLFKHQIGPIFPCDCNCPHSSSIYMVTFLNSITLKSSKYKTYGLQGLALSLFTSFRVLSQWKRTLVKRVWLMLSVSSFYVSFWLTKDDSQHKVSACTLKLSCIPICLLCLL